MLALLHLISAGLAIVGTNVMSDDLNHKSEPRGDERRRESLAEQAATLHFASLLAEATSGLEPEALMLRADLDGVRGNVFNFLDYFAGVIHNYKLKLLIGDPRQMRD